MKGPIGRSSLNYTEVVISFTSWRSYILMGLISLGVRLRLYRPLAPENLGTVYLVMGTPHLFFNPLFA